MPPAVVPLAITVFVHPYSLERAGTNTLETSTAEATREAFANPATTTMTHP
jgi:hypothetical protein